VNDDLDEADVRPRLFEHFGIRPAEVDQGQPPAWKTMPDLRNRFGSSACASL
jgi:hypothetical protein